MLINEFFPKLTRLVAITAIGTTIFAGSDVAALAQSFTAAPTPVYGSTESQASIQYHGPGLPGAEPQQSINSGSRQALFDIAGYDGVISSPVTPPYNSAAAYQTYAGQPLRGSSAILSQDVDGAP